MFPSDLVDIAALSCDYLLQVGFELTAAPHCLAGSIPADWCTKKFLFSRAVVLTLACNTRKLPYWSG